MKWVASVLDYFDHTKRNPIHMGILKYVLAPQGVTGKVNIFEEIADSWTLQLPVYRIPSIITPFRIVLPCKNSIIVHPLDCNTHSVSNLGSFYWKSRNYSWKQISLIVRGHTNRGSTAHTFFRVYQVPVYSRVIIYKECVLERGGWSFLFVKEHPSSWERAFYSRSSNKSERNFQFGLS